MSDSNLPTAEKIELTPEEMAFITQAECRTTDDRETPSPNEPNDKAAVSLSKGAVGAAVVGGVVGGVVFGGLGAIVLAGGAVYATTKSPKVKESGEKVYKGLSKAGKATKKGFKSVKSKFSNRR